MENNPKSYQDAANTMNGRKWAEGSVASGIASVEEMDDASIALEEGDGDRFPRVA